MTDELDISDIVDKNDRYDFKQVVWRILIVFGLTVAMAFYIKYFM